MESLILLGEILMVNLVLSGDNAVVIAMASKNLPMHQRRQAVWLGSIGAVLLRILLTWAAVILLKIPWIQAGGGLLLLFIAFKLLMEHEQDSRIEGGSTMWRSVQTILAADFVMSLDNVLAIAALAEGDLAILVIGIILSIPIVIWGSNLITLWLQRYPLLVYMGAAILAFTAGKMMLHDPKFGPLMQFTFPSLVQLLPVFLAALVIMAGWFKKYKELRS